MKSQRTNPADTGALDAIAIPLIRDGMGVPEAYRFALEKLNETKAPTTPTRL